jgi:hypothetical protein
MRIFAPNLYVCAYHLQNDRPEPDATGQNPHPLWQQGDQFLDQFTTTTARLIPNLQTTSERRRLPPGQDDIPFTLADHPEIEGFVQPIQLQDSYGILLNIGYDDGDPTHSVKED